MHFVYPLYLFNERQSWSTIFWASYLSFFVVSWWAHGRERKAARGDNRDRGSRPVIYIFSLLGLIAAFVAPSLLPGGRINLPHETVFATGVSLFWAGLLLYTWAILTLGAFFRVSVQLLDEQRLVTRGPYRLLRHPAYAGGILLFAGISLAIGNWFSVAVATLSVVIAYAWRIHVEEIALRERFGAEFEAHRRRTWAVIPLIW